ncbi:hypothetical protein M5689_006154 [Euphorbia peplus]|nr:hypothetical protein M5689_006154 [Euphorbia peplus]
MARMKPLPIIKHISTHPALLFVDYHNMRICDGDDVVSSSCEQDPLEVLGWDLMMKILKNLDACSVAVSLTVSRHWNGIASSDRLWTSMVEALEGAWMIFCRLHASLCRCMGNCWFMCLCSLNLKSESAVFFKCEELWRGKAHIPRMSQVRGIPKLAAYTISVTDAKRKRIMRDDLCDHTWEFHFTEVVNKDKSLSLVDNNYVLSIPCNSDGGKVAPEYWKNLDPYWAGTRPLMHRYFHQDGSQTADLGIGFGGVTNVVFP